MQLFVIILIPLFNLLFKKLDPSIRIFTPMWKIMTGFLLMAATAGLMSLAGFLMQGHTEQVMIDKVDADGRRLLSRWRRRCPPPRSSVLWIILAYIVLTFAEVLLYGTMLEFALCRRPGVDEGYGDRLLLWSRRMLGNLIDAFWSPMYGGSLQDAVEEHDRCCPVSFSASPR